MALTLRLVKGSALTHQEADDNFSGLQTAIDANVTAIADNATDIATNASDIDDLEAAVAAITGADPASTTTAGIVELATNAETITGTDADRAVTPAGLKAALDDAGTGGGGSGTGIAGTGASNFVSYFDTSGVGTATYTFPGTTDDTYLITYGYAQGGLTTAPATVQDNSYLFTGTVKGTQTITGVDATKFEILAVKLA